MRSRKHFLLIILILVISCRENVNIDLGRNYKLITSASRNDLTIVIGKTAPYTVLVRGHILDYNFDSAYIIVTQRPRDSVVECSGTIPNMTLNKCNEAFEKSTFRQFWIINKKEESIYNEKAHTYLNVYGPYQKDEYLKKRKEMGVSKTLELKN